MHHSRPIRQTAHAGKQSAIHLAGQAAALVAAFLFVVAIVCGAL